MVEKKALSWAHYKSLSQSVHFYKLVSKPIGWAHQFIRLNTLNSGSFNKRQNKLTIFDYFTDEQLRQTQEYIDFLLEIGRSIQSERDKPTTKVF